MAAQPCTPVHPVDDIETRVRSAFLRLTLHVGGLVAQHPTLPDAAVFALCRRVDETFRACLSTLRTPDEGLARPHADGPRPHPAVQHLLALIDPSHQSNQQGRTHHGPV
jgi:hypothetical protein